MLTVSKKTLQEHAKAGEMAFILIGRGKKRMRKGFDPKDILEFIERRRLRLCPSTKAPKVRSTSSISSSGVVAFTDLPRPPTRRKQKP
ncbi:hypothetical protein [Pararhizobium capsulatum]|uniref:hypothetical protein n=1 Tax=Pararhizobium capsulatum TaxID=34014 RepID=UPI00352225AF